METTKTTLLRTHFSRFAWAAALAGIISCVNFPTPFENIVANEKLRPFAVVCDPPEAAPGDTVTVRLYYYAPPGDAPVTTWSVALDYGADPRGNEFENRVVSLDSMMLQGSRPDSFRFRVPDSVLLNSTQLSETAQNPALNPLHLNVAAADSLLRAAAQSGLSSPQLTVLADNFCSRINLRAHMLADITLDVTMPLRIRYSNKVHSPNVNINPVISWMGIVSVPKANFSEADSIPGSGATFQYLFNRDHPDSVRDTVTIDSGCTYYVVADSGGGDSRSPRQIYTYQPLSGGAATVDTENYRYSWFYTNLDYQGGMVMDSLIMFGGGRFRSLQQLLPPVDTSMHRFTLYLVTRDQRQGDAQFTPGEAFGAASGYLSYTPAYARHTVRTSGGGRRGG